MTTVKDSSLELTVTEIIEKVKVEICHRYCKYMDSIIIHEYSDETLEKYCDKCPLNRL